MLLITSFVVLMISTMSIGVLTDDVDGMTDTTGSTESELIVPSTTAALPGSSIPDTTDLPCSMYGDFEYEVIGGAEVTITDYVGSESAVTIPSEIEGKPVTTIGDYAFASTSSNFITIPDSVTTIGDYAFGNACLTSITIPDSVTTIGNFAFLRCKSLTSVTIGENVTTIGEWPFNECSSLTSITIPDSVTTIGDSAFYKCTNLTSVTIGENLMALEHSMFYECTNLTSVTIGKNVTIIESSAFYGCASLTSVTIPDGVTKIYTHAFYGCASLTSVTIPDGVTKIHTHTFYGCSALTSVIIPDNVTTIGEYAFYGCASLTSITIPDGVTTIETYTFYGCLDLASITVPDNVTTIEAYAFSECHALTSITIPNSVTTTGEYAFSECTSLTSVIIGDNLTTIEGYMFYRCQSLTSITFGDNITIIWSYAFSECSSLTSITIPDSVTTIGEYAFAYCTALTSITFGDNVTTIGNNAFTYCTHLTSVTIPNSVTSIGTYAFYKCEFLTSVTIGDNITYICNYAFSECHSLTSVTIPDSVGTIWSHAFSECSSLESITIPDSVAGIGDGAFSSCTSLTSMTFEGGAPGVGTDWVEGHTVSLTIYYYYGAAGFGTPTWEGLPSECLTAFEGYDYDLINSDTEVRITGYDGPGGAVVMPERIAGKPVTTIWSYVFFNCASLTSVAFPDGLTTIGAAAFFNCTNLTSVTLPDGLTTIEAGAFHSCTSLPSITIPGSVTSIGDNAFAYCGSMTSITVDASNPSYSSLDGVLYDRSKTELIAFPPGKAGPLTIPDGVSSIEADAFRSCTLLTSVTIPGSVTSVGDYAFACCTSLTNITFQGDAPMMGSSWAYEHNDSLTVFYYNGTTGFTTPTWQGLPAVCLSVPDAPSDLMVVSVPGRVDLTWAVPFDGNSTITWYNVYRNETLFGTTSNTSYNDTAVVAGYAFTYSVTAVNDVGEGANSTAKTAHTIPAAPSLSVEAWGYGVASYVNLTWSPVADGGSAVTSYSLYLNGTFEHTYDVGDLPTCEGEYYLNLSVTPGYAYTYSMNATNGIGTSAASSNVTGTTVPQAPGGLTASSGPGYVNLTWTAPLDGGSTITHYVIYRNGTNPVTTENTWYNDTKVVAGNDYNYTVTAVNGVGEGAHTTNSTGNTIPVAPMLSGVANVRSNSLSWEFDLSGTWSSEGELINVTVLREGVTIATLAPNATSYVDDDIFIGVTYVYSVYANDTIGDSALANVTIVSLDVPSEPTGLAAVPGMETVLSYSETIVTIIWTAPYDGGSAIDHYIVYRDDGEGLVEIGTSGSTFLIDHCVENGTEYTYVVTAVNAVGEGAMSTSVNVTTYDVPTMPPNATLTPIVDDEGDTTVSFTWSAPVDDGGLAVISYEVYRDCVHMASVDGYSYNDTTAISGQSYCYCVRAVNALGMGDPAGPLPVTTAPAAPCDLAAEAVDASVTLTWTAPADGGADITSYDVYRNGTFLVNVTGTSYVDDTVEAYTWYSYSVTAVNAIGEGSATTVDIFVPDTTAPTVNITSPSDGAVIASFDVTVTWEANDTASGLASFNVTVDDIWYELNATTFSLALTLEEGEHVVIVTAYDAAGNYANSTIEFTVAIEPTVVDHSPTGDDASKDASIVIEFSEPMDQDSVTVTCGSVTLTPSWDGNVITLTHDAFDADTAYEVVVNGDDTHGNAMDEFTCTFTTENVVTVTGIVSNGVGPVVNATVNLESGETTSTDSDGRYTMTTTPGEHTITVTKDGFDTVTQTVTVTTSAVQTFDETLDPTTSSSMLWLGVIAALVVVAAIAFVVYRRR